MSIYVALLFVVLTPGVLLTLPKRGNKLTVALVHGLVFAAVYYLTHKMVSRATMQLDGFSDSPTADDMAKAMHLSTKKSTL